MATKNGVPFRQVLVPANKRSIKCPYAMNPKKITLHNTDNQMPAINEINYMNSNNNQTSYHVAVDEKEAIQGVPFNRNAWHSGDGLNGYGNRNTVAIEICRNYDRSRKTTNLNEPLKSQYSKAEQNAIKYVAQLCIDLGIVANNNNIKTHNNWNGKWCPSKILNENRLQSVKNAIIAEYNRLKGNNVKPSAPSKPTTSKPTSNNAKLIKNEDAYFLATNNIKVRSAPSTKATHTGTLKRGDSIHYYKVYEGNGYRWLQYVGNSGNKLYLPYRESGSSKEQWGTFHSSRPKETTAPTTKKIKEDGWFGKDTATLAQQVYGMKHVDGVISGQPNNASTRNIPAAQFGTSGSNLIRAMAKEFGVPAKYRDGKITNPSMLIEAMQKYYGTPVDKKVSGPSMVIKEWQKNLNKGKRK